MTTREHCDHIRGYYHDDAYLCSQVICHHLGMKFILLPIYINDSMFLILRYIVHQLLSQTMQLGKTPCPQDIQVQELKLNYVDFITKTDKPSWGVRSFTVDSFRVRVGEETNVRMNVMYEIILRRPSYNCCFDV